MVEASLKIKGSLVRLPVESTCLGFGPGPQKGVRKRQLHTDVSLPLFLPAPLFKNKYSLFKKLKIKSDSPTPEQNSPQQDVVPSKTYV